MKRSVIIVCLIVLLGPWQAIAYPVIVDPKAPIAFQPTLHNTSMQVPVIGITSPSAGGVSRNQFSHYNVEANGLVLNNSRTGGTSLLAGAISANPFLSEGAASVILHEVTGTSVSQLLGLTEVVGTPAAVIIANPNGVVCRGCGFINAPRVTLTTAILTQENGRIFDIEKGRITIEGRGYVTPETQLLDLIGEKVSVQGPITLSAQSQLNILAGHNRFHYAENKHEPRVFHDTSVAIDASTFGALQAGSIFVMSTAKGAGVRLDNDMLSLAGDISVDAAGVLYTHGNHYSLGDALLTAEQLTTAGRLEAAHNVTVRVASDYTHTGKIDAGQDFTLAVGGKTTNSGQIEATHDAAFTIQGDVRNEAAKIVVGGALSFTAASDLHNHHTDMVAGKDVRIGARNLQQSDRSFLGSNGRVQMTATQGVRNTDSIIQGQEGVTLTGTGKLENAHGSIRSGKDLSIAMPAIDNSAGTLLGQGAVTLKSQAELRNAAGKILAKGTLQSESELFTNDQGIVQSEERLQLKAGSWQGNRDGMVIGKRDVQVEVTDDIALGGILASQEGRLTLTVKNFKAQHALLSAAGDLAVATGKFEAGEGTRFQSQQGNLKIASTDSVSMRDAHLLAAKLVLLQGRNDMNLTAATLSAGQQLTVHSEEKIQGNQVRLYAGEGMTLTSEVLALTDSDLQANNTMSILPAADIVLRDTHLTAGNQLLLQGGQNVTHSGGSAHAATIFLTAGRDVDLADSTYHSNGDLQIAGKGRIAQKSTQLQAGKTLTLTAEKGAIQGERNVLRAAHIQLQAATDLNQDHIGIQAWDSVLHAGNNMVLSAAIIGVQEQGSFTADGDMMLTDAKIAAGKALTFSAQGHFLSQGPQTLFQANAITIAANTIESRDGVLLAEKMLELVAKQGDLLGGATLHSNHDLRLQSDHGSIVNQGGKVTALDSLTLQAAKDIQNEGGVLATNQALNLTAQHFSNHQGTILTPATLSVEAGTIDNRQGALQAGGDLLMRSKTGDILTEEGTIRTTRNVTLESAKNIAGNGATITAANILIHSVDNLSLADSHVYSDGALTLHALGVLSAEDSHIASSEGHDVTLQGRVFQHDSGMVLSGKNVTIETTAPGEEAVNIHNENGLIQAAGTLTMHAAGSMQNAGGILRAGKNIDMQLGGNLLNHRGKLIARGGDVQIETLASIVNTQGIIESMGSTRIHTGTHTDPLYGTLMRTTGYKHDDGTISLTQDAGSIPVSVPLPYGIENVGGRMSSGRDITIDTGYFNTAGGSLLAGNDLRIQGHTDPQVTYGVNSTAADIHANHDITWVTTGALEQGGGNFPGGSWTAGGDILLHTGKVLINGDPRYEGPHGGGHIRADGNVIIQVEQGDILNQQGATIQSAHGMVTLQSFAQQGTLYNTGGLIVAPVLHLEVKKVHGAAPQEGQAGQGGGIREIALSSAWQTLTVPTSLPVPMLEKKSFAPTPVIDFPPIPPRAALMPSLFAALPINADIPVIKPVDFAPKQQEPKPKISIPDTTADTMPIPALVTSPMQWGEASLTIPCVIYALPSFIQGGAALSSPRCNIFYSSKGGI